jgi:hypothetical protein
MRIRLCTIAIGAAALAGCGGQSSLNTSGVLSSALSYPACGAVTASWNGFNAYSNGNDSGTGNSCAGQGTWGLQYQCVELVMRYFGTHFGITWYGNAKDLLNNAPRGSVDVFYNGDRAHPPQAGDLVVFPPGGNVGDLGHVVLATSIAGGVVHVIQQNIAGVTNGYASLPYDGATVHGPSGWNWPDPQGWGHDKDNGGGGPGDPCAQAIYGGLYCGSSRQNGFTGGDINTIYDCENNRTASTTHCDAGCIVAPNGINDYCRPDPCAHTQYGGYYCGRSTDFGFSGNGDPNTLYLCQNDKTVSYQRCGNVCIKAPPGQNDYCN